MKKNIFYFIILLVLISCSKAILEEEDETYYFNLSETHINLPSSEIEFTVNISTNTIWRIISKPDWITVLPESGDYDEELQLSISENTTGNERYGEVLFRAMRRDFILSIYQEISPLIKDTLPLILVSYTGSESIVKMDESKFFLFNKPITLQSITSGDPLYSFYAGPNDIEYFDNNHGVRFNIGPSLLGAKHKYTFTVKDSNNNILTQTVDFDFYTQKINVPSKIKKMILDEDNNLWVFSKGAQSYIHKYVQNENSFIQELSFEVDVSNSGSSYWGGDFFLNPYNNYIYITNYEGNEVAVYSKQGALIKKISIPIVDSDHPQYPRISPVSIGFISSGKGIIALANPNTTGIRWRFIDSANNDVLTEPNFSHPFFFTEFDNFTLNQDESILYMLDGRTTSIKTFNGSENIGSINIYNLFPTGTGADASSIIQNKLNSKIYVNGLYNQQIITPDLSYLSLQSFAQSFVGDFCYDTSLANHIYVFSPDSNVKFKLLDYDNQITVKEYFVNRQFNWTNNRGLITTPDDKFVITYSDSGDLDGFNSQIVIYDTEMFK